MKLCAALFSAAAFVTLSGQAWASENAWGDGVEVMAAEELDSHRGGFIVGGIQFNFGAVVTTYVNGVPVLTTNLTWTDLGALLQQTVGELGENMSSLTPAELEALGVVGGGAGIVINDANGITALVHNMTDGALQNIIINSATGRDLTQEINVTLELPGFELTQANLITERLGFQISDDLQGIMFYDPGG